VKGYLVSFKINLIDSLNYKFNFVLTIFFALFPIVIQLFIWNNVYSGAEGGEVFGYSFDQMVYYAILSNFINAVISTNAHYKIGGQIKSGELNGFLVKPANYIGFSLAGAYGGKVLETGILGLLLTGFFLFGGPLFGLYVRPFSPFLFILLLILAAALNFFLYLCISLLTFWITDCTSLFGTITIVITVISGAVFPLDIFGEFFITLSRVLPFQYMVYVPLNYAVGKLPGSELPEALAIQCGWIAVLFILSVLLWRRGIRRYSAVGG
jgi:ABC-2 type transport system permease protein